MAHPARRQTMSAQAFLAWEASQAQRHEFIGGEVFAMAEAEDRHVTVALNLAMALRQHLAGTPCRNYMSAMKLHAAAAQSCFYPDVLATCSPADHASPLVKAEPSLREYVLVDIHTRSTEVYRKGSDGLSVLHPFEAGQAVVLDRLGLEIAADRLFAEVDTAPPA